MEEQTVTIMVPEGFFVIKPAEDVSSAPIACPVCDTLMCVHDDEAWKKFKCCNACADAWAFIDQARWIDGWRPNKDVVEENVRQRPHRRINVNV